MPFPSHLLIPLACGLVYVIGALLLKRSAVFGVGIWRTTFVANWMLALIFLPLWWWRGGVVHPLADYAAPATVAVLFLIGQIFMYLAITRGDVSVATPVLGLKVLFVALFSVLLGVGDVPLKWWIGAGLSVVALVLLNFNRGARHHALGVTIACATLSCAAFALNDVLLQKWVPAWGIGSFFPPMFALVALYSLVFIGFFKAPLRSLDRQAWKWMGPGVLLIALNNAGIVLTIGIFGDATAVNIIYSSRGLWSVVLVWLVGHWFLNEERHVGGRIMRLRLAGAGLILAAIILVLT